ncbi:MAG: MFS transporter [Proteobacteria bacterium]|nr:MFS transporter [Pseudomonadota bacterium]
MIATIAGTWVLLLGIALLMMGNGLQASLLGVRASLEGFSTAATGLVMSAYYVGFLLGSTLAPRVLRRVGHVRVFAAFASLASAAALIHVVFVDPAAWAAMRLVTGFCFAGLYVVAESWLNDRATNETRGRLLSIYVAVILGGMASGQLMLNAADPGGFELFILVSVLVSVAVIPMLLTATPTPSFDAPSHVGLRQLYAISPLGLVGSLGIGMAHGVLIGMGAVYAEKAGLSVAQISLFMGLVFVGGAALQWPIGRISDVFDRRRVIMLVTFLAAAVALAAVVVADVSRPGLLVIMCLFGGLSLPMYALCIAHTNDFLEPGQMVAASASLVLVQGVGATVGPLAAGAMMSFAGPSAFFWCLAVVHAAIGAFALYRMSVRVALPLEEQGPYAPVAPTTSPVAASLAPKAVRDQIG